MAEDGRYLRIRQTKTVMESYAEMKPLLAEGRVEEARDLLVAQYLIGPASRYSRDRPVVSFWIGQLCAVQVEYYVAHTRKTMGFFELQKVFTLYRSLEELTRQFILELGPTRTDRCRRTLLHDAAYCQLTGLCEFLLAQGYDPNKIAAGDATATIDALDGFEKSPLSFDAEFDPFRVKELFPTLLDGGADPDFPIGTAASVSARLKRLPKWYKFLLTADEKTRNGWDIPDLEAKIPLLKSCYVDVLEAYRQRKLGRK
ncbi:MAG: hypothetical protein ACI4NV_08755 [Thermoguttaceae bacterium]